MKKKSFSFLHLVPLLSAAVLAVWFGLSLHHLSEGRKHESLAQLENAIRRSAVAHYSATGAYPATLDDLCARYGIQIDESRYSVFYEIFAQNIVPEITVLEK